MKTVLVTGMSGLLGGAVHRQLTGKYELSALNRHAVEGVKCTRADIGDLHKIQPAFKGIDTVVHLAGVAWRNRGPWEVYLESNIVGTYNVFEASRIAGVKRIIFASSASTIRGSEMEPPYVSILQGRYAEVPQPWPKLTHEIPPRPVTMYGATKVWGEALARVYSNKYGISVICLRIGVVNPEDKPTEPSHFAAWCSQRDVARMVEKCIEAPSSVKFDIFYVTSNNKWGIMDLEHAKQVVGFVPEDSADKFA